MKSKYIVKDGYNGDIVYKGDNLKDAKKAMRSYDKECEGDWLTLSKTFNEKTGKYEPIEIKY